MMRTVKDIFCKEDVYFKEPGMVFAKTAIVFYKNH